MPLPDLTFGVEIECYLPAGSSMRAAAAAVKARLGRDVNVEDYNHQLRADWKVVADGSLGDYVRGCEFVSPILRGADGLRQIEVVCETLQDLGCTVNEKCGFHVHVGVGAPPLDFFKDLTKLYATFERVIDAAMPALRRGSGNQYCRSIAQANSRTIDAATSFAELMRASMPHGRFHKLNLHAFTRHKTVEFRQHSGTLDVRKTTNWTKLCLRMVQAALDGKYRPTVTTRLIEETVIAPVAPQPVAPVNRARPNSKAWQAGQLILRPQGATRTEICDALGWPSVSVPQQARTCGIEVIAERQGREVRYFARSVTQAAPAIAPQVVTREEQVVTPPTVEISLDGLCALIEADATERQFFQTRTANLSGSHAWAN